MAESDSGLIDKVTGWVSDSVSQSISDLTSNEALLRIFDKLGDFVDSIIIVSLNVYVILLVVLFFVIIIGLIYLPLRYLPLYQRYRRVLLQMFKFGRKDVF